MPHSLKDYDELHDGQGHLVRDSEEASRALEWVQQILEKDQDEHHGGVERKGDEDDEALPISDEAAAELRQLLEPLHPADVAWILEACLSTNVWPSGTSSRASPTVTFSSRSTTASVKP